MKYSYYYATGTESVEIDEEWAALLQAMDREEEANRKKETRRHYSLDDIDYEGEEFAGEETAETELIKKQIDEETLSFLSELTETQQRRVILYMNGKTTREIAKTENVNQSKVMKSLEQVRKKYISKNFFG